MRWPRVLVLLVIAVPLLALLAYGFTRDPRYIPSPLIGRPAPAFRLTLFDGRPLGSEELRGKVVFLNFWASWCVPCREEARTLEAAWQKYKDRGVIFIGASIQDAEPDARAFLQEFAVSYPNGHDVSRKISLDYGVWGIPETFIIDREGRITYKHVGALGWQTITTKLDDALRGAASATEGRGEYRQVR